MTNRLTNNRSGFTLIELLIASTIFTTVMVISMGIISEIVALQTKLRVMRESTNNAKMLSDMITRDIHSAKGTPSVTLFGTSYSSGLALFNCAAGSCTPATDAGASANTIIAFSSDKFTSYYFDNDNKVHYREGAAAPNLTELTSATSIVPNNYLVFAGLSGYAPAKDTQKIQPYLNFKITVETPDYNSSQNASRKARAVIQSTVTSRNYNY